MRFFPDNADPLRKLRIRPRLSPRPRPPDRNARSIGPLELFIAFSQLALSGFGGVLPWAHRALVERRGWLTQREFVETLALGQLLPGPNIGNMAVMIGYRFAGYAGRQPPSPDLWAAFP